MKRAPSLTAVFCVIFVVIFLATSSSTAQSLEELRKENAELKEKLRLLQENEELKKRIEALKVGAAPSNSKPSVGPVAGSSTPPSSNASVDGGLSAASAVQPAAAPAAVRSGTGGPATVTPDDLGAVSRASPAAAQGVPQTAIKCLLGDDTTDYERYLCYLAEETLTRRNRLTVDSLGDTTPYLANLFREVRGKKRQETNLVVESERKRTDKQVGSSPSNSGTTSLAVKGGGPAIIGWAVENGAATSSVNGNTVTVRLNPYNLGKALFLKQSLPEIRSFAGNALSNPFSSASGEREGRGFDLRKLSFGFSFDTSRGTEIPTLIVSKQQLASWSVRYEFINRRNPLSPRYRKDREEYFRSQDEPARRITATAINLFSEQKFRGLLEVWIGRVDSALAASDATCRDRSLGTSERAACTRQNRDIIEAQLEAFPFDEIEKEAVIKEAFTALDESTAEYSRNRENFLERVNRGAIATFEYTNNREADAPDTSNFRFIWEKGFWGNFDFTVNADLTVFNKMPIGPDTKRIRDFNFALQFDRPLNDILPFGNSLLSGAFRYTRQPGDVVLPNGIVADGTKGDIMFGQLKLTIPFRDTGLKFPISMTFGNRDEFIKEGFVRGNFGITFDLDQLFRPLRILQ